jgi:hypothetical protein
MLNNNKASLGIILYENPALNNYSKMVTILPGTSTIYSRNKTNFKQTLSGRINTRISIPDGLLLSVWVAIGLASQAFHKV